MVGLKRRCSVEGCVQPHYAHDCCRNHYYRLPEVKAHFQSYYKRPEVRARIKEYYKKYYARPEVHERMREYFSKPEIRVRLRKYYASPEVKLRNVKNRHRRDLLNRINSLRAILLSCLKCKENALGYCENHAITAERLKCFERAFELNFLDGEFKLEEPKVPVCATTIKPDLELVAERLAIKRESKRHSQHPARLKLVRSLPKQE